METQIHDLEQQLADLDSSESNYQQILSTYDNLQTAFKKRVVSNTNHVCGGILHGFGFGEDSYDTPINSPFRRAKTKLALAKILLQAPGLLILDEPTNYLDMNVLSWLEDYLKSYQGALFIVSHDRYFRSWPSMMFMISIIKTLTHYTGNLHAIC